MRLLGSIGFGLVLSLGLVVWQTPALAGQGDEGDAGVFVSPEDAAPADSGERDAAKADSGTSYVCETCCDGGPCNSGCAVSPSMVRMNGVEAGLLCAMTMVATRRRKRMAS